MIQPYKKGHDFSIMVWACFWDLERSNLYALERDFEAKKHGYFAKSYLNILDDNLLSVYQSGLIFMQDNAPIHTAKAVALWFREHGINFMEWPLYSPDMNPIEHLWFLLKEHVYKVNPHINDVVGDEDRIKEALFDALYKAWEALDKDYLHDLVWSMKRRVKALIAFEGWYTKY
jgi:transposase